MNEVSGKMEILAGTIAGIMIGVGMTMMTMIGGVAVVEKVAKVPKAVKRQRDGKVTKGGEKGGKGSVRKDCLFLCVCLFALF